MKKYTVNIGVDAIAAYNYHGDKPLGIPPSWPYIKYHHHTDSLFQLTPDQLEKEYQLSFPVDWTKVDQQIKERVGSKFEHNYFLHRFPQRDVEFNVGTVESFARSNTPFIYVFELPNHYIFNLDIFNINPWVKQQLDKQLAKVLFHFPTEGYITTDGKDGTDVIDWLNRFAILNNIKKEDLLFSHANLILDKCLQKKKIDQKFTYVPINYFEYDPWFLKVGSPHQEGNREKLLPFLDKFVKDNRYKSIHKHFNILNRRPHLHRLLLFTEVKSNSTLIGKCEISLGNEYVLEKDQILNHITSLIKKYPHLGWEQNYEFAKKHNFDQQTTLDVDLTDNKAADLNRDFYRKTFCSIITETSTLQNQLFLSEKIFKPIFNLHPFITLGNKGTMKHLRECGYKTFSRWWSEDYDEIEDEFLRIKRISAIMEEICSWPESKLIEVTQEMEETLIHNFITFLYNKRYLNFIEKLTFSSNINTTRDLPVKTLI